MVSTTLFYFLMVVCAIAIIAGIYFLLRNRVPAKTLGSLGIVVMIIIIAVFNMLFTRNVYVIEQDGKDYRVDCYVNFGAVAEIALPGQERDTVHLSSYECLVINRSDHFFIATEHLYGTTGGSGPGVVSISRYSAGVIRKGSIDYFPGDAIPHSVRSKSSGAVRWSLQETRKPY